MKDHRHLINENGFSIIEVLFAVAIFAIGALGIVTLFYTTSGGIRQANDLTEAVFISEDYLARTLEDRYIDMRPGNFTEGKYRVAVNITPNPPVAGNVANITITVSWPRVLGALTGSHSIEYLRAETRSSGI